MKITPLFVLVLALAACGQDPKPSKCDAACEEAKRQEAAKLAADRAKEEERKGATTSSPCGCQPGDPLCSCK
jgi:hypothetical protein